MKPYSKKERPARRGKLFNRRFSTSIASLTPLLAGVFYSVTVFSDNVTLEAIPKSCVALHRGQKCFGDVTIRWQASGAAVLCLFRNLEENELICSSRSRVSYKVEYASATSEQYTLKDVAGKTVASVTVSTAWVYRTGKRSSSSWRLF